MPKEIQLRGVIFDKDGTLFDYHLVWSDILSNAVTTALNAIGKEDKPAVHKAFLALLGVTENGINPQGIVFSHKRVYLFFKTLGFCIRYAVNPFALPKQYKNALAAMNPLITKKLDSLDFTAQQQLFKRLKEAGYAIGIVTSDNKASSDIFLDHMGLTEYVDFLVTRDTDMRKKPNPQAFNMFCEANNLTAAQVAMVGDTPTDMLFARKSKSGYCVAVLSGSNDLKALNKLSDVVYKDVLDLENDKHFFPTK